MSAANPFQQLYDEYVVRLYPPPIRGYKAIIYSQVAGAGLLLAQCLVYLALSYVNSRKRGRQFYFVHLVRIRHGRLIVLNSLLMYVSFTGTTAIVIGLVKREQYLAYILRDMSRNYLHWTLYLWLPAGTSAWVFVFPHIIATLKVKKQTSAVESASSTWVILHNTTCIGVLIVFYAVAIATCTNAANKFRHMRDVTTEALALLLQLADVYRSNPANIDVNAFARLSQYQTVATKALNDTWPAYRVALGVLAAFVLSFGLAAATSFSFVLYLRSITSLSNRVTDVLPLSKPTRSGLGDVQVHREQITTVEGPGSDMPVFELPSGSQTPIHRMSRGPAAVEFGSLNGKPGHHNAEEVRAANDQALIRLAKDLTYTAPAFAVMCFYFTIAGIVTVIKVPTTYTDFRWLVFFYDGFTMPYLVISNVVLAVLTYNILVNHPGRGGQSSRSRSSHRKSLSSPARFGSFKIASANQQGGFSSGAIHFEHDDRSSSVSVVAGRRELPIDFDLVKHKTNDEADVDADAGGDPDQKKDNF